MTLTTSPTSDPIDTFAVRTDGSMTGDDGAGGSLATTLGYVVRLTTNLADLLATQDLTAIEAAGGRHLAVEVSWSAAREASLRAQVELRVPRERRDFTVVGGVDIQAALAHSVGRAKSVGGLQWAAVITSDLRLAGASMSATSPDATDGMATLTKATARAVAAVQAMANGFGGDHVALRFGSATVLVAPLSGGALVGFATDVVVEDAWLEAVDEVRAVLAGQQLADAPTLAVSEVVAPAPAAAPTAKQATRSAPRPVGARYRAAGVRRRG